ncbi:hypothetical protein [Leucobacter soli]|uniref:hypothetical protein n=1 Tax=Leucobacter soli TaxID=2812850 RepID=UPI00360D517F
MAHRRGRPRLRGRALRQSDAGGAPLLRAGEPGAREFGDAVAEGYRVAEEEFSEALDDVERRLAKLEAKK